MLQSPVITTGSIILINPQTRDCTRFATAQSPQVSIQFLNTVYTLFSISRTVTVCIHTMYLGVYCEGLGYDLQLPSTSLHLSHSLVHQKGEGPDVVPNNHRGQNCRREGGKLLLPGLRYTDRGTLMLTMVVRSKEVTKQHLLLHPLMDCLQIRQKQLHPYL